MKRLAILFALLGVVASGASAIENVGSVGVGHGIQVPGGDTDPCGGATLFLNYDGTAENGYCWQYGGIVPPYYGAFAECYEYVGCVCGIELGLTGIGYPCNSFDAYVWDDAGGMPGNVLGMTSGLNPCPVATWPNISTHDLALNPGVNVNGLFWIGYWANNSAQVCGYFVAADLDGFGGCPFTNIAPGIGYPTGWQNASNVWGATQSIGIGAWTQPDCGVPPNPVEETTWGQIKNLY
jgi:hypothetical protein